MSPLQPLWTDCLSALSLLKDSQDQRPVEQLNLDKCQVGKLLRKIESWHHGSDEEQRAFEKSFAETSFVVNAVRRGLQIGSAQVHTMWPLPPGPP